MVGAHVTSERRQVSAAQTTRIAHQPTKLRRRRNVSSRNLSRGSRDVIAELTSVGGVSSHVTSERRRVPETPPAFLADAAYRTADVVFSSSASNSERVIRPIVRAGDFGNCPNATGIDNRFTTTGRTNTNRCIMTPASNRDGIAQYLLLDIRGRNVNSTAHCR